jgi:hypothetical protein
VHRLEVANAPGGGAVVTLTVPERFWQGESQESEEIKTA